MKKLITLLLVFAMLFSLAACSKKPDRKLDLDTGLHLGENDKIVEVSFDKVTVVDNAECLIEITGMSLNETQNECTLEVNFENRSADKTYLFRADDVVVEDTIQATAACFEEIGAGKRLSTTISVEISMHNKTATSRYTDIALTFVVSDSDASTGSPIVQERVRFYPYGEDEAIRYEYETKSSDILLLDNDVVTVIATDTRPDDFYGYMVDVYILNKTDMTITTDFDEVSVNDCALDGSFTQIISAGKCAFDTLHWDEEGFERNGISTVEAIEATLLVHDLEKWPYSPLVDEKITLHP